MTLREASTDLTRAIELEPNEATAFCHRGFAWLKKTKLESALEDLNHAIELDPKMAAAFKHCFPGPANNWVAIHKR